MCFFLFIYVSCAITYMSSYIVYHSYMANRDDICMCTVYIKDFTCVV